MGCEKNLKNVIDRNAQLILEEVFFIYINGKIPKSRNAELQTQHEQLLQIRTHTWHAAVTSL